MEIIWENLSKFTKFQATPANTYYAVTAIRKNSQHASSSLLRITHLFLSESLVTQLITNLWQTYWKLFIKLNFNLFLIDDFLLHSGAEKLIILN
jgi:hypothetical protein